MHRSIKATELLTVFCHQHAPYTSNFNTEAGVNYSKVEGHGLHALAEHTLWSSCHYLVSGFINVKIYWSVITLLLTFAEGKHLQWEMCTTSKQRRRPISVMLRQEFLRIQYSLCFYLSHFCAKCRIINLLSILGAQDVNASSSSLVLFLLVSIYSSVWFQSYYTDSLHTVWNSIILYWRLLSSWAKSLWRVEKSSSVHSLLQWPSKKERK